MTHHRLKTSENGEIEVDPGAKLEEELIIRPTSETIIWKSYKNWIQSYRDLPILINQWCNVMRWEMRNRPFLRSSEILWQEGHTAHATQKEAIDETEKMLEVYFNFGKNYLAIPFLKGLKTETEKFAGAEKTYTIEAIMQDGKALQCGTSHFLGQNFSKVFDVKFTNKEGKVNYVWGSSWGVTTRLVGALIMTHSDDDGLVLPPKIAPVQIIMIPIFKNNEEKKEIENTFKDLNIFFAEKKITAKLDSHENISPGWKFNKYETEGVPIRIVIGPNDIKNQTLEIFRRDTKEKITIPIAISKNRILNLLDEIQENLYIKAVDLKNQMTHNVDSYEDFKSIIEKKRGFIYAHWCGEADVEKKISEETKATIRCIPFEEKEEGICIYSKKKSEKNE